MKSKYFNLQEEKHNIKSKLYTQDDGATDNIVIFCHGFAGHKDSKAAERLANKLVSKNKNFALLAFDFPCHGDDVKKKLSLSDCITYFSIVIDKAKTTLGAASLFVNATSFGAFLVLKYISENENPFKKIVLRSPAVDMYKVMSSTLITDEISEKLKKGRAVAVGFDRKVNIDQQFLDDLQNTNLLERDFMDFADNMLIIHGTADELAPFSDAKFLSEENVIDFIPVEGADHRYKDLKKLEYANAMAVEFYGL